MIQDGDEAVAVSVGHCGCNQQPTVSVAMVFLQSNDLSPRCLIKVSLLFLFFFCFILFFALLGVVATGSAVVLAV